VSYIDVRGVSKIYEGGTTAIGDVSFTVEKGEFVSIVGPSGCGKSTLLRAVAGLRGTSSGTITVGGRAVTKPYRVGMVFQTPALMPWRTVRDNVLAACVLADLPVKKYERRADELLEIVGLSDFAKSMPSQLSGGMQQRVSLCRALIHNPDVLLMDEPFGALDALTRDDMGVELTRLLAEEGQQKTVLFVTHSISEAIFLSDRILVMSTRPGRIIRDIASTLPRPRDVEMRTTDSFGSQVGEIFHLLHGEDRRPDSTSRPLD
jgi:NitT/TauT family transport system ATP-binding protein